MDFEITNEVVQIIPNTQRIRGSALIEEKNIPIVSKFALVRRDKASGSIEELNELNQLYKELTNRLSISRIESQKNRILAEWDKEFKAVRVLCKVGKIDHYGYKKNDVLYLEFYETLYLLEMNRLQLSYNSKIVSIEQAYVILLGEQISSKQFEYMVYAHLTKVGHILKSYRNIQYKDELKKKNDNITYCIQMTEKGTSLKKSHSNIEEKFNKCNHLIDNEKASTTKRIKRDITMGEIINDDENTNYIPVNHTHKSPHSLIDILLDKPEYQEFQNDFKHFDIIKLKTYDEDIEIMTEMEKYILPITFDMYMRRQNKKSGKSINRPPDFRIIIITPQQMFPNHVQIYCTNRQQLCPVPLLLATINESNDFQAYLYLFS